MKRDCNRESPWAKGENTGSILFSEDKNNTRTKGEKIDERSEEVIHRRNSVRRTLFTLVNRLSKAQTNTGYHFKPTGLTN